MQAGDGLGLTCLFCRFHGIRDHVSVRVIFQHDSLGAAGREFIDSDGDPFVPRGGLIHLDRFRSSIFVINAEFRIGGDHVLELVFEFPDEHFVFTGLHKLIDAPSGAAFACSGSRELAVAQPRVVMGSEGPVACKDSKIRAGIVDYDFIPLLAIENVRGESVQSRFDLSFISRLMLLNSMGSFLRLLVV